MIENIDFNRSEQYTLSIRLGTDGFSFSVFNPLGDGEHTFYDRQIDESLSLTANLKQTFREVEWLNRPYKRVNALIANKRFTFVPLEFFDDEQVETVFYHNLTKKDNELIQYDILHTSDIVVLYAVDKTSFTFLHRQFADIKFHAQSSPLIEHYAAKSRLGNSRKMYVYLQTCSLNVYVYERGRLLLANHFDCKVNADRVYYLLYIWKELGLDQERDELHLSGRLNEKKDLLAELQKFIRQIFVMNQASNLDLQTINLCE